MLFLRKIRFIATCYVFPLYFSTYLASHYILWLIQFRKNCYNLPSERGSWFIFVLFTYQVREMRQKLNNAAIALC